MTRLDAIQQLDALAATHEEPAKWVFIDLVSELQYASVNAAIGYLHDCFLDNHACVVAAATIADEIIQQLEREGVPKNDTRSILRYHG